MRLVVLLALAACTTAARPHLIHDVERAAVTDALAAPVVFGPVADPATVYNQPIAQAASTPVDDAVFAGLAELARDKGEPERDMRLDRVATELAELAGRGGALDDEVVSFALHARGIVEPAARIAVSNATESGAILAELGPKVAESLYFGNVKVGVGGTSPTVVLVVHTSLATLAPTTPRYISGRGEATMEVVLDPSMHAPHVTVTHDDRTVERPTLTRVDRWTFRAPVACGDHTGEQWVLIEACDARNTLLRLALFPIACGTPPETTYRVEPRANTQTPDLERRLAAIINRERAAAHLPALAGDLRADDAARTMASAMRRDGRIDHEVGGTTRARLLAANLIPPYAFEATLHAPDLAAAAEILMNVPGYRELLLHPEVSHVGVGIARDPHGELYIALELVYIVPKIDTERLRAAIVAKLQARMPVAAGGAQRKLPLSPRLSRLAEAYIAGRAVGWSEPTMMLAIQRDPAFVFSRFGTMKRAITMLVTDDVDKVDLGSDPADDDGIGVAVRQAPRDGALVGRTWVLILHARSPD